MYGHEYEFNYIYLLYFILIGIKHLTIWCGAILIANIVIKLGRRFKYGKDFKSRYEDVDVLNEAKPIISVFATPEFIKTTKDAEEVSKQGKYKDETESYEVKDTETLNVAVEEKSIKINGYVITISDIPQKVRQLILDKANDMYDGAYKTFTNVAVFGGGYKLDKAIKKYINDTFIKREYIAIPTSEEYPDDVELADRPLYDLTKYYLTK
jgi:hypothetical protein